MSQILVKTTNGVEVSVFDNAESPFTLDLYMRRFVGNSGRIQAFHAELTPDEADLVTDKLRAKANKCRERAKREVE